MIARQSRCSSYCGIPADDEINQRIKGAAEHWIDIRAISDDDAAAAIAADGVDILVDVMDTRAMRVLGCSRAGPRR